jgi:hypothetical protein
MDPFWSIVFNQVIFFGEAEGAFELLHFGKHDKIRDGQSDNRINSTLRSR